MKNKNKELLEATKEFLKFHDCLKQYHVKFEQKDIDNFDKALLRLRRAVEVLETKK